MNAKLGTIIIYAKDMQKTASFYSRHFGFKTTGDVVEGLGCVDIRGNNTTPTH
ncbi:VOC family protein [Roseateles oligotrophus]|uniref:VOC family protein n=1 Tax=Roseateles oligotrophus TaxID=1769250 RepID=UPI00161B8682|nr:VOC family protein [Roseateles oligotrophus]